MLAQAMTVMLTIIPFARGRIAMATPETKNSVAGTVVRLVISALLWLTLLVALVFVVPGQRRLFAEHSMALPEFAQLVTDISRWFADYWYVTVPFFLPLFVVAAILTWVVRHRVKSRSLDTLWTLVFIGLPFALNALIWFSLYLPRIKLTEGLAR